MDDGTKKSNVGSSALALNFVTFFFIIQSFLSLSNSFNCGKPEYFTSVRIYILDFL